MISVVLAKQNGETLRDHIENCLDLFAKFKKIFPYLDKKTGYPNFYDDVALALFYHDFGKAAKVSKNSCNLMERDGDIDTKFCLFLLWIP